MTVTSLFSFSAQLGIHITDSMAAGPYNYSYIFKYIIIGDMGVGKSCLLHQFTEKKCNLFNFYIFFIFILVFQHSL